MHLGAWMHTHRTINTGAHTCTCTAMHTQGHLHQHRYAHVQTCMCTHTALLHAMCVRAHICTTYHMHANTGVLHEYACACIDSLTYVHEHTHA